jgi:hypothetical protein
VRAFLASVLVAQAADLVGAPAAVPLPLGDLDSLAAVVEAAEQGGDPRAQLGIDGEALVGLQFGIGGAGGAGAARQGGQRG